MDEEQGASPNALWSASSIYRIYRLGVEPNEPFPCPTAPHVLTREGYLFSSKVNVNVRLSQTPRSPTQIK